MVEIANIMNSACWSILGGGRFCVLDCAGIKFVKKIGPPNRRGMGRETPADAKPLGPWNMKSLQEFTGMHTGHTHVSAYLHFTWFCMNA
jgi:hypothetical protein